MLRQSFFIIGILFSLSLVAQSADKLFMEAAITKLQHAKEYTLQVAKSMPEDKYAFKPVPEEMSFREQLLHLADNLGWLTSAYLANQVNPITKADMKKEKKDEIITVLNRIYDYSITGLQHFDAAHLGDTVNFFAGPMNKLQIINLINDHQTHHRAQ